MPPSPEGAGHLASVVVDIPPALSVDSAADPLVGRVMDGRYRLDAVVARGGMATVYVGHDERLDRVVAVKVMHRALADDPGFVAKFAQEARSAARLSTPEVVAVHDQGTDPATGAAFLVMEYVPGRTLRDLLRERGALPPARALALLEPVLRALAAAHTAGIVHRDVKPENVLLGDDGRVKVADFGLARAVASSGMTATTGLLMGTVAYLAPEQVETGVATVRSDVYAAGVMLWEVLTGAPPYSGETQIAVALSHVNHDVPAPSTVVTGIPVGLDDLVQRATSRDPAGRPADAGAFLAELLVVRSDLPPAEAAPLRRSEDHPTRVVPVLSPAAAPRPRSRNGAGTGSGPPPARPRWARRHRGGLLTVVLLLLASLLAAGGWYLGSGRYTQAPGVLGLTLAGAEQKLTTADLRLRQGAPDFDDRVPVGQVLRQDPGAGGRVPRGGTVTLTLSKGVDLRAVPTLQGLSRQAAVQALEAAGLTAGPVTEAFSPTIPTGEVVSSTPTVSTRVRPRTVVSLVLSRGVELLPVPDVQGRTQDDAARALAAAGFRTAVTTAFSDTLAAGQVLDQSPSQGTAPRDAAIALVVSKGPDLVTVPQLAGLADNDAEAALSALGLRSRVRSIPGPGVVRDQDPSPGSRVRRGSTVTLYVF